MTERLHFLLSCTGEGNGNPLQCSCLENPRDGGAWWAAVCGVTQSWTRLKWLSSSRKSGESGLYHWISCESSGTDASCVCIHFQEFWGSTRQIRKRRKTSRLACRETTAERLKIAGPSTVWLNTLSFLHALKEDLESAGLKFYLDQPYWPQWGCRTSLPQAVAWLIWVPGQSPPSVRLRSILCRFPLETKLEGQSIPKFRGPSREQLHQLKMFQILPGWVCKDSWETWVLRYKNACNSASNTS